MLRYKDQWEELVDRERLVLLAIAFELISVSSFEVRFQDVFEISGLQEDQFERVIRILEVKDLIRIDKPDTNCVWISLAGDALTRSLGGEKAVQESMRRIH